MDENPRAGIDPLLQERAHRARTSGSKRNDRRARNRRETRLLTAILLPDEKPCVCLGSIAGELQYGVKPAACGHWFTERQTPDGKGLETGFPRGAVISGGPNAGMLDLGKWRPIRDLERGRDIKLKATHGISFREMIDKATGLPVLRRSSTHALKNTPKRLPPPTGEYHAKRDN